MANFRVKQTEDIVKMGDEIWVKCLGVDEKGRVRLSRKAAMAERDAEMGDKTGGAPAEPRPEGQEGGEQPQPQPYNEGGPRPEREHREPRGDREHRGGDRGGDRGGRDRGPRGPRR
ncbi:hypothetical protein SDC9_196335 [bioreactor metagenome]|uniref:S1 motif domain-containing protein n=1 Tax=bioreactor metagenome TaxID=1076179 RepID=A0A645INB0_9ZZZZ